MKTIWLTVLTIATVILAAAPMQAGRWISRDPIQEGAGFVKRDPIGAGNLYVFVSNDSTNYIDPKGLQQVSIWASAFIPSQYFVFPYPAGLDPFAIFYGDGRNAPQVGGRARAYHLLTIETDPTKEAVVSNTSGGGVSTILYRQGGGLPKDHSIQTSDAIPPVATVTRSSDFYGTTTIVTLSADTSDPLIHPAPDLHYNYTMVFHQCFGFKVTGSHGRFPGFDLIIDNKPYLNYIPTGLDNEPFALLAPSINVNIDHPGPF